MSEYIYTTKTHWYKYIKQQLIKNINSLFDSFSDYISLEMIVPTNILYRTEMICEYISKQVNINFGIYDLISLLYINLIYSSTEKYEPLKILKTLTKTYGYNDIIKIYYGDIIYQYPKTECNSKRLIIKMSKIDASKGQLLLDELYDLYGQEISLDKMVFQIWINFIEDYKRGDNNKNLTSIITMLKSCK